MESNTAMLWLWVGLSLDPALLAMRGRFGCVLDAWGCIVAVCVGICCLGGGGTWAWPAPLVAGTWWYRSRLARQWSTFLSSLSLASQVLLQAGWVALQLVHFSVFSSFECRQDRVL